MFTRLLKKTKTNAPNGTGFYTPTQHACVAIVAGAGDSGPGWLLTAHVDDRIRGCSLNPRRPGFTAILGSFRDSTFASPIPVGYKQKRDLLPLSSGGGTTAKRRNSPQTLPKRASVWDRGGGVSMVPARASGSGKESAVSGGKIGRLPLCSQGRNHVGRDYAAIFRR